MKLKICTFVSLIAFFSMVFEPGISNSQMPDLKIENIFEMKKKWEQKTHPHETSPNTPETENKCGKVEKLGWGEHEYITTAYEMSGCDKDFVLLLEAENGMWSHDRRHNPSGNTVGVDWGFCGINDHFHPKITQDERFLTDWEWQMSECLRLYRGGTTFYGVKPARKTNAQKNIIFY